MIIEFTTLGGTVLGRVNIDGVEISSDADGLQGMIEDWLRQGKTAAQFALKFQDWSNGYLSSEEVTDSSK